MTHRVAALLPPPLVVGVFVLLMAAYHFIFGAYFPLPNGLMGHDYSGTLPGLMDGFLWFRNNGFLTPPWFTPSFCGGQVSFADPQAGFYSIPQFLTFFMDPQSAAYAAMLVFAALGFWGMYVLARSTFALSPTAALVAATIFMFNGFYSHRLIVGHYGYQPFMLVPWLAWLLCMLPGGDKTRAQTMLLTLCAGLVLAYWVQGGLGTLMVPAGLSVLALSCIADFRAPGTLSRVLMRGSSASLIALSLSASRLVSGAALLGQFERTYYPLPGIGDPLGLFKFVLHALFYSSQHAFDTVTPLWKNIQWTAMPHETAFGLTFIALALIAVGALLRATDFARPHLRPRLIPLTLLIIIVCLPFALLYYSPEWNEILKRIPIFGSTTSPARWLIILIPLLSLLAGMAANLPQVPRWIALAAVLGVPALNAMEYRGYYESQNYDPRPVLDFYRAVKAGNVQPGINRIEDPRSADGGVIIDNLAFTRGATAIYCYNPLFGYRLEKYRPEPLEAGPVDKIVRPGRFNLRNPACLLYPEENSCSPWDTFRTDQRDDLLHFAQYRPFAFKISRKQEFANLLSELALAVSLIALVGLGLLLGTGRRDGSNASKE